MKGSENFITVIQNYLDELSSIDEAIKIALNNESKNMDDCISYILNTVKNSGFNGFEDQEIYNMAVEYYTKDNVEIGNPTVKSQVIINRIPVLTEQEKAEAKQKAFENLVNEEKQKISKKSSSKANNESSNLTLF